MDDIALKAEGLGKRYRIGRRQGPSDRYQYKSLRDSIAQVASLSLRTIGLAPREYDKPLPVDSEIWALRNVDFEIRRGEIVGIVGSNGAGKSTLLKVLSRITSPSEGRVEIRGRVGSLLEVGTGFHPELSGRDNIYLNGAILGMKRTEIRAKFDEIVAFAEVERFVDTVVKHYSSGMYLRLAFAVAAHLDPDILLIDEVLAVGDFAFQQKCLGRIGDLATNGRTVLFVSHNMAAVANLCFSAYLFRDGTLVASGTPDAILPEYMRSNSAQLGTPLAQRADRRGNGRISFTDIEIDQDSIITDIVASGRDVVLRLSYQCSEGYANNAVFSIAIYSVFGQVLLYFANDIVGQQFDQLGTTGTAICSIPRLPLGPGVYDVNINCDVNGDLADWIPRATRITVVEGDFFGTGKLPPSTHGGLLLNHGWELIYNRETGATPFASHTISPASAAVQTQRPLS